MSLYPLDYQGIDQTLQELSEYLQKQGVDRKEITRSRLTLEEILMKYRERFQDGSVCELFLGKRFGRISVLLKIKGDPFDPGADASAEDRFYNVFMQNLGQAPIWRYKNGENRITLAFVKKRKISLTALQLGAIPVAAALGLLLKALLPSETMGMICESFMDPVNATIMGMLSCTAVFFLFFSIVNGICSMGDIATFNKIGKKMFARILILMFCITAALCLLCLPFFRIEVDGSGGNLGVANLWQMIVSIVPTNFVDAFLSGNSLQVSFLSILAGVILLTLGAKGENAVAFFSDMNNVIAELMQWILRFLPVTIFISIFELVQQDSLTELAGIYKYPLCALLMCLLTAVYFILQTCIARRIPVGLFLRKIMPVALIAFTTASSAATISESYKICEEKLGVDKRFISMGWPVNNTFLGIAMSLDAIVASFACAELFHVPITISVIISLELNACILGMAAPKVPNAMVTVYTLIFGLLGIPTAAVSLLIPLQILMDRFMTVVNCVAVHAELVQQAGKVGMLDREILLKDN